MQRINCMPLENLNVHTTCRTCLTKLEEYHPIIFEIPEFQKIFTDCTALPVKLGDGLPTGLCESCFAQINDIYVFQQMCRTAARRYAEYDKIKKKNNTKSPVLKDEFTVENIMSTLETIQKEYFLQDDDTPTPVTEITLEDRTNTNGDEQIEYKLEEAKESTQLDTNLSDFDFNSIIICDDGENDDYGDANVDNTQKEIANKIAEIETKQPTLRERLERLQTINRLRRARTKSKMKTKTKSKGKTFCCETCGKVLKKKSSFEIHMLSHTNQPRPHACHLCPKRYNKQSSLKEHLIRHSGIKNFVCPVCGIKKFTQPELKFHMNKHTKEKVWKCDICDREFCSKLSYARHKAVIHEGIKKFKCTYCDRVYALDYQRRNHERFHRNERPFVCQICGKSYTLNGHLKTHLEWHTRPKKEPKRKHSCEFCGAGAKSMNDLINHAKAMHGGMRYQCSYCEKDFSSFVARNDHESIHTGENLKHCDLCPRVYHSKCALSIHKRRNHKDHKPAEPMKAE